MDDLNGGFTAVTFDWTIADTNHPPFIDHYGIRHSYVGQSDVIGEALDIDGDDPQITEATGLPPGMVWDPELNLIYGTLTTAGTYQVTISVDDGHCGTDTESFTWNVYRNDLPPPPLGLAGFSVGAPSGIDFTLTHPAAPLLGSVTLQNPADPEEPLEVTLSVEPAGRGTINPTSVMLRDGESATFEITPTAISQEVHDAYVSVRVSGQETCRAYFTNVGMVLPRHVRGPDTPEGMKDRISSGTGNWGSYNAVIGVYPNLLGLYNTEVDFVRPEEDDKYGAAAADATDAQRLAVATQGVVKVFGTVQTEPTADGLAGNAGKLRLRATVSDSFWAGNVQLAMARPTSVAVNLLRIGAWSITKYEADQPYETQTHWNWGVGYEMLAETWPSSVGDLRGVFVGEVVKFDPNATGIFAGPNVASTTWHAAHAPFVDYIVSGYPKVDEKGQPVSKEQARRKLQGQILAKGGSKSDQQQFRFYNSRVEPVPASIQLGHVVGYSGFLIERTAVKRPVSLEIERQRFDWPGGPRCGMLTYAAWGVIEVQV